MFISWGGDALYTTTNKVQVFDGVSWQQASVLLEVIQSASAAVLELDVH